MDYSLYLVIEQKTEDKFNQPNTRGKLCQHNQIYHFGIIDYLQEYDTIKQLEHLWRATICQNKEPSASNPNHY